MDFNHRYYKINKNLLSMHGLWPYQSFRTYLCFTVSLEFSIVPYVMAFVVSTVKSHQNGESMIDYAIFHTYLSIIVVKVVSTVRHLKTMLKLLNRIRDDWQVWSEDQEITFLHRYADQGRTITIICTALVTSTGIVFMTEPLLHKIIDVLLNNGSQARTFPVPLDFYFFDGQKYYYFIMMYSWMVISLGTLIQAATDSMFYVYVQHCCGLFAALAHKLERIGNNVRDSEAGETVYASKRRDMDFENLVSCINRHNDAIQFAELIETTYSWCFFVIMALDVFLISILGVQIITNSSNLQNTIKFIIWSMTALAVLYYYSYMCQILMDHSLSVCDYIINGKWYCLSLKAQKLLLFMLMRSSVPCKLTAGKVMVLTVENYTSVLKTCMSFFTFLNSM